MTTITQQPTLGANVISDISADAYHAHPALSATGAKRILKAPALYRWEADHPTPSTKTFAARLRQSMLEFETGLKENENFRIIAVLGGKAYTVEHIAVRGSEMAVIDGPADEVNRYRILSHVNSLQLMLQVEPKQPHEKRRRIGFLWEEEPESPEQTAAAEQAPEAAALATE